MEYTVYKYIWKDEVIYVGKSNTDLWSRIKAHEYENRFKPYLKNAKVFYINCNNPAETTILETYFINKYQPVLNTAMKYDNTRDFGIKDLKWHEYNYRFHDETTRIIEEVYRKLVQDKFKDKTYNEATILDEVTDYLNYKGII